MLNLIQAVFYDLKDKFIFNLAADLTTKRVPKRLVGHVLPCLHIELSLQFS